MSKNKVYLVSHVIRMWILELGRIPVHKKSLFLLWKHPMNIYVRHCVLAVYLHCLRPGSNTLTKKLWQKAGGKNTGFSDYEGVLFNQEQQRKFCYLQNAHIIARKFEWKSLSREGFASSVYTFKESRWGGHVLGHTNSEKGHFSYSVYFW